MYARSPSEATARPRTVLSRVNSALHSGQVVMWRAKTSLGGGSPIATSASRFDSQCADERSATATLQSLRHLHQAAVDIAGNVRRWHI